MTQMCNCNNISPQDTDCYNQMITVEIPQHMHSYRINRLQNGLSSKVSIDPCCFSEIWLLWKLGIVTYGCCCGHNSHESFVNVSDNDIERMVEMGYIKNHPDTRRTDTFKLKSV